MELEYHLMIVSDVLTVNRGDRFVDESYRDFIVHSFGCDAPAFMASEALDISRVGNALVANPEDVGTAEFIFRDRPRLLAVAPAFDRIATCTPAAAS